jgi:hypothetical protein
MNRLLSMSMLFIAVSTFGQSSGRNTTQALDFEAEHSRIQTERSQEEARFGQEEVACYSRFSVNDCLSDVRVHRREVLSRLRRQELSLNEAERKKKALEQLERINEKSSGQQSLEPLNQDQSGVKY